MTRKQKLIERAARFSDRMQKRDGGQGPKVLIWDNAHDGFLGGYRAAMSELRKELKDPSRHFAVVVADFLKPPR